VPSSGRQSASGAMAARGERVGVIKERSTVRESSGRGKKHDFKHQKKMTE